MLFDYEHSTQCELDESQPCKSADASAKLPRSRPGSCHKEEEAETSRVGYSNGQLRKLSDE